jgi:UDP-glucose 4-epimerase
MNIKRALVTGGAGFIGSHLVETLFHQGCKVTVVDDLSTGHKTNLDAVIDQISFFEGDIRDEALMGEALRGCEVVFHQAALVSVPESIERPLDSASINEMGTLNVLEMARQHRVKRVVIASSSAIYGDDPKLPKKEDMPAKPLSPYAIQKLTGEYYARLYERLHGLETVCLRYFNVFGPRQDPSSPYSGVISIFMTKVAQDQAPNIYGDGEQTRDFIFVKDVVNANLLAATVSEARGNVFNIGTGQTITVNKLWEGICNLSQKDLKAHYLAPRPGDILESVADIQMAQNTLTFSPQTQFNKGLESTYNWYLGDLKNRT